MTPGAALQRLRGIPGLGVWTAAETARSAFGNPDVLSIGDYHLPNLLAWALAGDPRLGRAITDALARGVPVGAGGSRLLRGNHEEHELLESEAAGGKHLVARPSVRVAPWRGGTIS